MATLPKYNIIYLPELMELLENSTVEEQKELLIQYYNKNKVHRDHLQRFVELMLHPDIHWEIPEGAPKYTAATNIIGQGTSNLFTSFRAVARMIKGGKDFIAKPDARLRFMIIILESLSSQESDLLLQVKDKKLKYKNINMDIFIELFPQWIPEGVKKEDFLPQVKKVTTKNVVGTSETPTKKAGRPVKKSV